MDQPCDTYFMDTASCPWDTTGLTAGSYAVQISVSDAMGNAALQIITVTVEETVTDGGDGGDGGVKGGGKGGGNGGGKGGGNGGGKPKK
jgi:hypothetical protein